MIKRTVSLILCIISLVSFCSMPKAEAANEGVKTQLIRLYNKFPHGKYWNHVGLSDEYSRDWGDPTVSMSWICLP